MTEEYHYIKSNIQNLSVFRFVLMLGPFSLLSIFGLLIMLFFIDLGVLNFSVGFIILVLLSSITIPHSIVMESFYARFYNRA